MLLLLSLALAAAPPIQLSIDPGAPCELATRLLPALQSQQLALGPTGWRLVVHPGPHGLIVRLTDGDEVLVGERVLNSTACDVLPHTVALLVSAWVRSRHLPHDSAPLTLRPSGDVVPSEPRRKTPLRAEAPPSATAEISEPHRDDPSPEALPQSEPTAVDPPAESPTTPPPLPVSVAEAPAEMPQPPAPTATPRPLTLELLGGAAYGDRDQLTAQGQLLVEWAFVEPWGVALDLGLQSSRVERGGVGAVTLDLQFASLLARFRFSPVTNSALVLGLGARLDRLAATATGYQANTSATVIAGGPVLTVQWRQTLVGGLFLAAHVEGHLRTRVETFSIEPLGTVLTLPPLGFSAGVGVGITFR